MFMLINSNWLSNQFSKHHLKNINFLSSFHSWQYTENTPYHRDRTIKVSWFSIYILEVNLLIYLKLSSLCNNIGNGVLFFWNRYWLIIPVCEWWKTKHQAIIVCSVSQSVSHIHLYFNLSINSSVWSLPAPNVVQTEHQSWPSSWPPADLTKLVDKYNSLLSDICIIQSFIFSTSSHCSALTLNIVTLNK